MPPPVAGSSVSASCAYIGTNELARENIARLRAAVDTLLLEPVSYQKVAGTGFYEQFLDTAEWPDFMRAGRASMLDALRLLAEGGRRGVG